MESSVSTFLDVVNAGRAREEDEARRQQALRSQVAELPGIGLRQIIEQNKVPELTAIAVAEVLHRVKVIPDPEQQPSQ